MSAQNPSNDGSSNQNPMMRYYDTWIATTPAMTRLSMQTIVAVYLFSWFIDLSTYFSNIPYYTVYSLEIYRVLLSPLVGNSFFTVLILFMFYPNMAARLENGSGSGGFLALMGLFSLVTNLAYVGVAFLLSILMQNNLVLFWPCSGFWTIVFPLMVVECMQMPEQPRKFLCFPVNVPSKYFPLALYALFMLLGGPQLSDLLAIGVGYAYSYGYLETMEVSAATITDAENQGILKSLASVQGWIPSGMSQGSGAWAALAQQDPDSSGGGGGGAGPFSGFSQMMGGRGGGADDPSAAAPKQNVFEKGMGHSLGGAEPTTKEELAAQRLAALSRLEAGGGKEGSN